MTAGGPAPAAAGRWIVLLFGPLREAVGAGEVAVEIDGPASAGEVLDALAARHPDVADLLAASRLAVNRAYADRATPLSPGDEIAVVPPVGGG